MTETNTIESEKTEKSDSETLLAKKIEDLKKTIAVTKIAIIEAPDSETICAAIAERKINVESAQIGEFKKGSNINPVFSARNKDNAAKFSKESQARSRRPTFWKYVVKILDLLKPEYDAINENSLTMAEIGAMRFVQKVADGIWTQQKEVIDRECGRVPETIEDDFDSQKPKLIKLPFAMTSDVKLEITGKG